MSHRVDVKSEMTDRDILVKALEDLKWGYKADGDSIEIPHLTAYGITASVNVKTGEVIVDHMKTRDIQKLKQTYAVTSVRQQALLRGDHIESETVLANGTIRLLVRSA